MRTAIAAFLAISLGGCSFLSPQVGPVTGSLTVNTGKPPVVVTKTVVLDCEPAPDQMEQFDPLPPITASRLSPADLLALLAEDARAYNRLNTAHSGLVDWVGHACHQAPAAPATGSQSAPGAHDLY